MATLRTKSISTKVTEAEYDEIARCAEPRTVSAWARGILVDAAQPDPLHFLLLAEVVALRTIVLNLNFAVAASEPPTEDAMRRLIDRADAEKFDKAKDRIAKLQRAVDFNKAIDRSRSTIFHSRLDRYLAVWQLAENRASRGVDRMPRTPVLLTTTEVAELLRTSRKAIYAMVERAQLPGVGRIRRRVLIREDALLDWLRQKSAPSPER
jgi:excisionase family DNA binding protein